jgi:hypothetical protein
MTVNSCVGDESIIFTEDIPDLLKTLNDKGQETK